MLQLNSKITIFSTKTWTFKQINSCEIERDIEKVTATCTITQIAGQEKINIQIFNGIIFFKHRSQTKVETVFLHSRSRSFGLAFARRRSRFCKTAVSRSQDGGVANARRRCCEHKTAVLNNQDRHTANSI
jgi:hypothetical protein